MKTIILKSISPFLIVFIVLLFPILLTSSNTSIAAGNNVVTYSISDYQAIFDKVNSELGSEARFPTDAEIANGIVGSFDLTIPLDEFESQLRTDILELQAHQTIEDEFLESLPQPEPEDVYGPVPMYITEITHDEEGNITGIFLDSDY